MLRFDVGDKGLLEVDILKVLAEGNYEVRIRMPGRLYSHIDLAVAGDRIRLKLHDAAAERAFLNPKLPDIDPLGR